MLIVILCSVIIGWLMHKMFMSDPIIKELTKLIDIQTDAYVKLGRKYINKRG